MTHEAAQYGDLSGEGPPYVPHGAQPREPRTRGQQLLARLTAAPYSTTGSLAQHIYGTQSATDRNRTISLLRHYRAQGIVLWARTGGWVLAPRVAGTTDRQPLPCANTLGRLTPAQHREARRWLGLPLIDMGELLNATAASARHHEERGTECLPNSRDDLIRALLVCKDRRLPAQAVLALARLPRPLFLARLYALAYLPAETP